MFRYAILPSSWDRRGKRAEERGEWGGTKERERSEPPLKSRDSASLVFNKERCAKIEGGSLPLASFSTTPLASFLGSLPLLSQEG